MLTAVIGVGYTMMKKVGMIPTLEGLQNTALGQTQVKDDFYIF